MGQIVMKTEGAKKKKAIERDIGVIAECIGDVRKYLTSAMLSIDVVPPQRSMGKVNCRYYKFWKNQKLLGRRLMCSCRKIFHQRQFVELEEKYL